MSNNNGQEVSYIAAALRNLDKVARVLEKLLPSLAMVTLSATVDRERISELHELLDCRLERIEQAILLRANAGKPDVRRRTKELEAQIVNERIESLKTQLREQHRNKNIAEQEAAKYGSSPPLHTTTEIIRLSEEIERLKAELDFYKELL